MSKQQRSRTFHQSAQEVPAPMELPFVNYRAHSQGKEANQYQDDIIPQRLRACERGRYLRDNNV